MATHNRQESFSVREEVVVETRQINPAAGDELDVRVGLDGDDVLAVNDVEDIFLLLLHLLLQSAKMLDDLGGADKRRERGHIMQRGIVSQQRRAGRGQELLVSGSHGAREVDAAGIVEMSAIESLDVAETGWMRWKRLCNAIVRRGTLWLKLVMFRSLATTHSDDNAGRAQKGEENERSSGCEPSRKETKLQLSMQTRQVGKKDS